MQESWQFQINRGLSYVNCPLPYQKPGGPLTQFSGGRHSNYGMETQWVDRRPWPSFIPKLDEDAASQPVSITTKER